MDQLLSARLLAAALIAAAGGVTRGITGFGAAMIMTPALALLLGPQVAVPVTLILEAFAAAPMLPAAVRAARWKVLAPIVLTAVACTPIGIYVLATTDPTGLRRVIALCVITFSLLLLIGVRYTGSHRLFTSLGLGGISGTMLGATSIGAPPVILYLLSGPDPVEVTRSSLTGYVAIISAVGLVMLAERGFLNWEVIRIAAVMCPFFIAGVVAGVRLFSRFSDRRFRQLAVALMLTASIGVLVA